MTGRVDKRGYAGDANPGNTPEDVWHTRVDELVATVREAIHTLTDASFGEADDAAMHENSLNGYAALDELAAVARDAEQRAEEWKLSRDTNVTTAKIAIARAVAAEARLSQGETALAQSATRVTELREAIVLALPAHGGVCNGTDEKPSAKDPRGSFANPCVRCQVLLALDAVLSAREEGTA